MNSISADAATRSTDGDALLSRLSAAALGYIQDDISPLLLTPSQKRQAGPRPALINIGTHARTWAIDRLVQQFVDGLSQPPSEKEGEGGVRGQVLSLGAGTDARYWRMRESERERGKAWCVRWIEVDFAEGTGLKARAVATKPRLKSALGGHPQITGGGTGLTAPDYAVLPCDLRDLAALSAALNETLLDRSLPTLLLTECVLVYIPSDDVSRLLGWFTERFKRGRMVSYDPFGLNDNFGKVMIRNLAARGLTLPSAASTPTLRSLDERLLANGFDTAGTLSIAQIRAGVIPPEEIQRVARIEMLDEVEELNLVLDHYAVTWGAVGSEGEGEGSLGLVSRS